MKMKNKIMYLVSIVIVVVMSACGETKIGKVSESIKKAHETNEINREEFDAFFNRFSEDSIFQLSRVNFPISYYSVDIENNKETYVYSKEEFWYTDFTKDREAVTLIEDAYETVIEEGISKTLYIRKGIDNGIRIEYYFEMNEKGEWYLVKIIDYSN
jgi:hypothetical protein